MEKIERVALRRNTPFVLLSAATAVRGMAFWLCWLGMLNLASFTLKATAGQIALVTAATSLPHIILSPFIGTMVDRIHPKWSLIGAYVWNIGIGVSLLFVDAVWQIYIVAFAWSTSGAIIWPAIGSLLKQIVPESDLTRANGTLHGSWEATLIAGPILTSLLIHVSGPRAPMALGALLSLGSVLVLVPLRARVTLAERAQAGARLKELREGVALMMRLPDLRSLALWGAGVWAGFNVLIAVEPVFIRDVLHGTPSMLNWMYSVGGIGSTFGALALGWFAFSRFELRTAAGGLAMAGILFAAYIAIARWPHVLPMQAFIGMGFAVYQTASQSLIQRRAPVTVVGRALAAKRQIEELSGFVGSLAAGALAAVAGVRQIMLAAGAVVFLSAIALFGRSFRVPGPAKKTLPTTEPDAGATFLPQPLGLDPAHDRVAPLGIDSTS